MTTLIAPPGAGKTNICEATGASFLNPEADALGVKVSEDCKGVLIIDNERTTTDVWNSFRRMCKRADIPHGAVVDKVKIAGLRAIPRANERKMIIEHLLTDGEYSLLLIDGWGDLVDDTNDLGEAIECRIWAREITVKYGISILTTVHPNPGSTKPRGHTGSEALRESECTLLVKPVSANGRIITSDFEYGKNRNQPPVTTGFIWSDEHSMFISADPEGLIGSSNAAKENKKRCLAKDLVMNVLPGQSALTYSELEKNIQDFIECGNTTAKTRIKEMTNYGFIKKHVDGLYRPVVDEL